MEARDSVRGGLKLEYRDGVIYAMTGSTATHAQLITRLTTLLDQQTKEPCRVYSSSLNIHCEATGVSTYPDISIFCGEARTKRGDKHAYVNPTVVVEVLSDSTEAYDRGDKLSDYRQITTVQAVLLVSQWEPEITLVERTAKGWSETCHKGLTAEVQLKHPRIKLPLRQVFRAIRLEPRPCR